MLPLTVHTGTVSDEKLTGKITEMQPRIHLKGFRPGKAPVSFLKKAYRKSLMGEIVNDAINQSSEQLLKERALKPATTPRVDFVNAIDNADATPRHAMDTGLAGKRSNANLT